MSDTVKLIIDISKDDLKRISDGEWIGTHAYDNMILNGTPLDSNDSDYAEVQAYGWEQGREALIEELKTEILRGHVEADLMHVGRIIEILDNIGKESEDKNDKDN